MLGLETQLRQQPVGHEMTESDEVGRGRDADAIAFIALFRRLYVEVAQISGHGDKWLRAMEERVVADVRNMKPTEHGKIFNPITVDMACDVVTKVLTGLRSGLP